MYQVAVEIPLREVGEIWQAYERFERHEVENNDALAGQLLEKHRPSFKAAFEVARERGLAWEAGGMLHGQQAQGGGDDRLQRLATPPLATSPPPAPLGAVASDGPAVLAAAANAAAVYASGASGGGPGGSPLDGAFLVQPAELGPSGFRRAFDEQQAALRGWRKRIAFERANKERLPPSIVRRRVVHG